MENGDEERKKTEGYLCPRKQTTASEQANCCAATALEDAPPDSISAYTY
jgi:hypothetical protein